jgi:hypothetical protein
MTFWEKFVAAPRRWAQVIQNHAAPGNIETSVTYEILMAQAEAAERILRERADQSNEKINEVYFGVPK